MRKIMNWVFVATLVCGAVVGVVACDKANAPLISVLFVPLHQFFPT